MWKLGPWKRGANAAVWLGVGMLTAVSAWPVAAQRLGYAAIAVSPSTTWAGAEKGTTTEASVDNGALQYCESKGARDCKIYSAVDSCVALAWGATPDPNKFGVGKGATRDGAGAQALAQCTKAGGISCVVTLAPCGSDDVRFASPLPLPPGGKPGSVDPAVVGLWALNVNGGIWVWQISANGTDTSHSEATDGTLPQDRDVYREQRKVHTALDGFAWDDHGNLHDAGHDGDVDDREARHGHVVSHYVGPGVWRDGFRTGISAGHQALDFSS